MTERRHASPQFDMHLLKEVGPEIGIGLKAASKPPKQCPVEPARFFVQSVLLVAIQGSLGLLLGIVAPFGRFLQVRQSQRPGSDDLQEVAWCNALGANPSEREISCVASHEVGRAAGLRTLQEDIVVRV